MTSPAIHYGMPYADYAALPGWSWSVVKRMHQSPLHVWHARHVGDEDTTNRAWLRAVHCLTLEPELFRSSFTVYDGRRGTNEHKRHVEAHPGQPDLKPHEFTSALTIAEAIRRHPAAIRLLVKGHGEVSMTWTDEATGLPCKGRIDWLSPVGFVDVKGLGTTHEQAVARLVARNLYHGQLAHYDAGLRANGIEARAFVVAYEPKPPHDVAVFEVDDGIPDGALHVGRELRADLLGRVAACVAADHWPGRHEAIVDLCLPSWALLNPDITIGAESHPDAELTEDF